MRRRDFLKTLTAAPALLAVPRLAGVQIKITDIRLQKIRLVKEVGKFEGFLGPQDINTVRIGGGTFLEMHTDQGLVGIGPGIDPIQLPTLKAQLVGRDPFDLQILVGNLREWTGMSPSRRAQSPGASAPPAQSIAELAGRGGATGAYRAYSAAEIAMWDIIGKACNQPLYKLWGPTKDHVAPYASQSRLGTPEERADLAAQLKGQGWRGIKYRTHFQSMKDDIRVVELARKAVGDDFEIMCDANQATNGPLTPTVLWDFRRAATTAKAYDALNVYWLEEPLPRYDFEHLEELNRMVTMPLAGGEGNIGLHEFRWLLEKGIFDIVQPEVLLEGPLEMRKIAVLAESMNKQVAPHVGDGMFAAICNMHLIASWPNAIWLEIFHDLPMQEYSNWFAIFDEPPVLTKDGYLPVPQKPGLGVSVKKDLILPS
jgi:L-alanine-DL-glutamate epimerase-like enolase superfamily enzyme